MAIRPACASTIITSRGFCGVKVSATGTGVDGDE
jgi:hypothetical protein